MKDISAAKVKEGQVIQMGHFNFHVMEVDATGHGDVILRGCYHDPAPDEYPTATQVLAPDDFVTVYR